MWRLTHSCDGRAQRAAPEIIGLGAADGVPVCRHAQTCSGRFSSDPRQRPAAVTAAGHRGPSLDFTPAGGRPVRAAAARAPFAGGSCRGRRRSEFATSGQARPSSQAGEEPGVPAAHGGGERSSPVGCAAGAARGAGSRSFRRCLGKSAGVICFWRRRERPAWRHRRR